MKKRTGIILVLLLAAGAAGGAYWYTRQQNTAAVTSTDFVVFADAVAGIAGLTDASGRVVRYSGVVEPQRIEKVELSSGMKVKEIFVTVGQSVDVGTKLFAYDTEEAQDSITKLEIDLENADISIESTKNQITQLEKERDKATGDTKLSYTTQIMTAQNSVKRAEFEKKSKQADLDRLKSQLKDAVVKSTLKGVIKTIKKTSEGSDDSSDMNTDDTSNNAFMTIMAVGEYRIKGKVNEQNMSQLQEGTAMIVHSRADTALTWNGTLSTIDREKAETNKNDMGSSSETSSHYPFYVELESSAGLMLGQHVYLVADQGQEERPDGIYLDNYYLISDAEGTVTPYVWAVDSNDKLEKREVSLGTYQEDTMKYEILSGLSAEDYIVYPAEELQEGMPVTKNEYSFSNSQAGEQSIDEEGLAMETDELINDDVTNGEAEEVTYVEGAAAEADEGVYVDGAGSENEEVVYIDGAASSDVVVDADEIDGIG